ncbi:MAG: phosphoribosyltransferase family protein [Rubrivivax sp.]
MKAMFTDRAEAGRLLAARLAVLQAAGRLVPPFVVLALPRGGVPVAAEVARRLGAPLDLIQVRKIGAPWQHELAVAAVVDAGGREVVVDEAMCRGTGTSRTWVDEQAGIEWREIERRREAYGRGRAAPPVEGCTAIVVDDGIATGTTMRAALLALRRRRPAHLVLAVPVAPHDALVVLGREADLVVCLAEPEPFRAVGQHYADFHQVGDEEVIAALGA